MKDIFKKDAGNTTNVTNQQKLRAIFSYTPNPFKPSRGYSLLKVANARKAVSKIPLEDVVKFIIDNPYRATAFFDKESYSPFRKKLCHRPDLLIRLFAARDKKINEAIDKTGLLYSRHFKVAVMEAQRLIDAQGQNHSFLNTLQKAVLDHRYNIAQDTIRECINDPKKNAARIAIAQSFIDFYDKKMEAIKRSEKYNPQNAHEITEGLETELEAYYKEVKSKDKALDKKADAMVDDIFADTGSEESRDSLLKNTGIEDSSSVKGNRRSFAPKTNWDSVMKNTNIESSSSIKGNSESYSSADESDSWESFGTKTIAELDKLVAEDLKEIKKESKAPKKPLPKLPSNRQKAEELGRAFATGRTITGERPFPKKPLPKTPEEKVRAKPLPVPPSDAPKKPLPKWPASKEPWEGMANNPLAKRFGKK